MASGYVRQATANIQPNLEINAEDFNAEFNALASAFDNTLGHDHSGSSTGDGAKIILTTAVTGILPIANGGTGLATLTAHGVLIGEGATTAVAVTNPGTTGQIFTGVTSGDPTFQDNINIPGTAVITGAVTSSGLLTGANITTAGTVTATGTITGGNLVTAGTINATGLITGGTISTAGTINATGSITSAGTVTGAAVVASTTPIALTSGGTGANTALAAFANIAVSASSIAQPGYIKFQNGLIIQWASVAFGGGNTQAVTFPLAFPAAVFAISQGISQAAGGTISLGAGSVTLSGFTFNLSTSVSTTAWYIVIGN